MTMTCLATKKPKSSQGGTKGLINPHSNTKQTGGRQRQIKGKKGKATKKGTKYDQKLKSKEKI